MRVVLCVMALVVGCGSGLRAGQGRAASAGPEHASIEAEGSSPPPIEAIAAEPAITIAESGDANPEPAPPGPRAWLFRVSPADGSAAPSYLFGTMHVGVAFPRALPPPLDATLYAARALVMELDLREAALFLATSRGRGRRTRSDWIDRALPRATWRRLLDELAYVAAPEQIAPVPPGALAAYLRQVRMAEIESVEDGWERIPGTTSPTHLDRWIFRWAEDWHMPIVALETPEEAVAVLSDVPRPSALATLRRLIDDAESARDEARRMRHAYLSLDEAEVLALLEDMSVEERAAMFDRHNELWLTRLLPELRTGNAFVAVGLAHLVGEHGLVALLRREGLTVERVLGDGGLEPTEGAEDRVWIHAPPRSPY